MPPGSSSFTKTGCAMRSRCRRSGARISTVSRANDVPHSDAIARIARAQKLNGHARIVPVDEVHARKQAGVLRLLTAFRSRGHLAADLDPLAIAPKMSAPDLELAFHGLAESDLDTVFDCGTFAGGGQRMKLRELRDRLQ